MNSKSSELELENILNKFKFSFEDKKIFKKMIKNIFNHKEFQRRMNGEYKHHDNISLGHHILEVAAKTYLLSKKYVSDSNFDIDVAVKIAMFHDLYELPWQNNPEAKVKHFSNKHGFKHPVEAVINSVSWFPAEFKNDEKLDKIIDGIIHHMYPLGVTCFKDEEVNCMELKNFDKIVNLKDIQKEVLYKVTNRCKICNLSICKSKYKEGKIVSKADKIISMSNFKNISSLTSLLTGHNKNLKD